jgi:hypothetical protein
MIRSDRPILEGPLKPIVIIRQFLHPIAQRDVYAPGSRDACA